MISRKSICNTVLFLILAYSYTYAQQGPLPPFTIELEQVDAPQLPGIHSYVKAVSDDKWLIVTGRIDGLHSFFPNSAFAPAEANQSIIVIDTDDWQVWSASVTLLPYSIRTSLSVSNAEFIQQGNQLYIVGGYGFDSLTNSKITFPTLTAINVDAVINEVVSGNNNLSPYIRQISDTVLSVTGGALQKIGATFFLVAGHNFTGLYTKLPTNSFLQKYTNSISSFQLEDDGTNISITNFSKHTDTINFHRRDFNAIPLINGDGSESIGLYGGVFQYDKNLPYLNPVYINETAVITDTFFEQKMSQYTCPVIPCFDSVTHTMYTTFFGGISLYDCNDTSNIQEEDTLVPFINDITTVIRFENDSTTETVLPVKLSGLYGANADFFPVTNIPKYENGVLKLSALNGKQLIGYLYGGINTNKANEGYSYASNLVFRVYLTPDFATSTASNMLTDDFNIFPNPVYDHLQIRFSLNTSQRVAITLVNLFGEEIATLADGIFSTGNQQVYFNAAHLTNGIYAVRFISGENIITKKLMIIK
ncbi:MAG: T9SS type A sorting domain-containing protein [Chitinophagaceae bacterium]|nr:T9SS type A sorting domain-containing protein [Chitinophagaceae bacterium]